jgi:DNA-binding NtrC family response regulator
MNEPTSQTSLNNRSEMSGKDHHPRCSCLSPMPHKPILIIEDDEQVCEVIQQFISEMGFFSTEIAMNVEDALRAFSSGKFFAIILDLCLGKSIEEGMDLATSFRDQDDNVYIAVMSGFEPPFDQRLLGSIDDFLSKPIDYKFLQSKLLMWSIQANRRLALKNYFDERMIAYLSQLARICEEQQEISEQIAEVAEIIQANALSRGKEPNV